VVITLLIQVVGGEAKTWLDCNEKFFNKCIVLSVFFFLLVFFSPCLVFDKRVFSITTGELTSVIPN